MSEEIKPSQWSILLTWAKANQAKLLPLLTAILASVSTYFVVPVRVKTDPSVTTPEIVIVFPESSPVVGSTPFGNSTSDTFLVRIPGLNQPDRFGPAEITLALKIAVAILERVAPRTPNTFDDRLLALLQLFAADPQAFDRAERAANSR